MAFQELGNSAEWLLGWMIEQQPEGGFVRGIREWSESLSEADCASARAAAKILTGAGYAEGLLYAGNAIYMLSLTQDGLNYFEEKAEYGEVRRQELRDQRKHEWALTHVTGMYGIAGVLLGIVIGYLLGRL